VVANHDRKFQNQVRMAKRIREPDGDATTQLIVRAQRIESQIIVLRGHKVMLDHDLAPAYGVPVKRLNEAVKRNAGRFPVDFMFPLAKQEFENLKSQSATPRSWGGRRSPPYAFSEHGVVMLASVLNSPIAIEASIQVVRAFVRLRQLIESNEKLRKKLARIENRLKEHDKHFGAVFDAIRLLMEEEDDAVARPRIGYQTEEMGT